ncbi:MAG: Sir2 family NAD-dependent protein deacetylase, partial [Planctomycetota bacterium]
MTITQDDRFARAVDILGAAERIAILTGAGVSAESGLATFRDKEEGLWSKYDPMELAHIDAFHRDPELVTRWYHWRFTRARDC